MKHALYAITKNIPPPAVTLKSKRNGLAQLMRSMKKGDSVLIPTKQTGSIKNAAHRENIMVVCQRIGSGNTTRFWHMGPLKQEAKLHAAISASRGLDTTDTTVTIKKGKWRKRNAVYWGPENAAHRSAIAKRRAATRRANLLKEQAPAKRKYTRRHASLTAKTPRATGVKLFTPTDARPL